MFKEEKHFTCYMINNDKNKMAYCHEHDAIEINFVESGEVLYEVSGKKIKVRKSEALIIDASQPHKSHFYPQPFLMYGIEIKKDSPVTRLFRLEENTIVLSGARFLKYIFEDIIYMYFGEHNSEYLDRAISYMLSRLERHKNEAGNFNIIKKYVVENYYRIHSISDISSALHISAVHLQRQFRQTSGKTVWSFVNEVKAKNAAYLLLNTDLVLPEIEERTGFESRQTFYTNFIKIYGSSPSLYRTKNNRSE